MKVSECLNNIPETPMGYIRLIQFAQGGEAQERMMDSMTNRELMDIQQKDALHTTELVSTGTSSLIRKGGALCQLTTSSCSMRTSRTC